MTAAGAKRRWAEDGRVFRRVLRTTSSRRSDGLIEVRSPAVGCWRGAPPPGALVMPGAHLGEIEALGVLHELDADDSTHGLVVGEPPATRLARVPVGFGDLLLVLDPSAGAVIAAEAEAEAGPPTSGLVFRAPSSGRCYRRPAPDKPPFVEVGQVLEEGGTICLLEVMKTFHRIGYGGPGMPARGRVVRVLARDGADLEVGDPILELEDAK